MLRGLGVTGGVITAAGLIMAGCFGAPILLPNVAGAEVASAIVIGVLLDTLLVRTVLVPASLLTIGDRMWWPRFRAAQQIRSVTPAGPPTAASWHGPAKSSSGRYLRTGVI